MSRLHLGFLPLRVAVEASEEALVNKLTTAETLSWQPEVGAAVGLPGDLVIYLVENFLELAQAPCPTGTYFPDLQPHFLAWQSMGEGVRPNLVSLELITQGVSRACSTPERVGCLGTVISCLDTSEYLTSSGWSH